MRQMLRRTQTEAERRQYETLPKPPDAKTKNYRTRGRSIGGSSRQHGGEAGEAVGRRLGIRLSGHGSRSI